MGPERLDVSTWPAFYQERYALFSVRCSRCHSLARPLTAQLEAGEWRSYLKRMTRRPGSGINERDAQRIYEFLDYYTLRRAGPAEASPGTD